MIVSADSIYIPPQRIGFTALGEADGARVGELVTAALAAFELDGYSIANLTAHSNVTARLVSNDGPALALRLRSDPMVDARTEFEWLNAVRRGTGVCAIQPFAEEVVANTRVVIDSEGIPAECALFLWVDGRPLAADLTVENYRELGRLTAQLHEFASTWIAPDGLRPLIWDRTMYYEGTSLVITEPRYDNVITPSEAETVEEVVLEADNELNRLARAPDRMFLHGNIEMWNVLTTGPGQLCLLDFEDVMFGSPVLDIAITLYYGRERDDHAALSEAYERGYCSVRDWPVRSSRQMDLLVAARAAMLLNHALQTQSDKESVTSRLLPLILAAAS